MRHMLLLALAAASLGFAGCASCEYKSDFWWMARLVPAETHEKTTTGSGATYNTQYAAMPAPATQPCPH